MATDPRHILISDYDYPLPEERIALHPLAERDACRLLVSLPDGTVQHRRFSDLPALLPADSLLVANDTRVINARLRFRKPTGALIEVMLLEPLVPAEYNLMFADTSGRVVWKAMVGRLKRWKVGETLATTLSSGGTLRVNRLGAADGNAHEVELLWDDGRPLADIIEEVGNIPIPPYLRRESEQSDTTDYQTVFARIRGSVAAPTAGLHFTDRLLRALADKGIGREAVTLHVGAGTFLPVKAEEIGGHDMHTEVFSFSRRLVATLAEALRRGRQVTAVGTTSVRTLESLPLLGAHILRGESDNMHVAQWEAYDDDAGFDTLAALDALLDFMVGKGVDMLTATTAVMIAPGFRWRIVNCLVTNFHQPQSTLLLLVSSLLGGGKRWRELYDSALAIEDYRFLSYGDACLLYPPEKR